MPPTSDRRDRDLAVAAAALFTLTALALMINDDDDSTAIRALDRRVRGLARSSAGARADRVAAPLFPLGLPGVYIPVAHAAAWWLGARGYRAGRIPVTAWSAWLAHRAVKLVYHRDRPRGRDRNGKRKPRRSDSYPSGHTTGVTALSLALAKVLAEPSGRRRDRRPRVRGSSRGLLAVAPLIMGSQRLLADDHWASDVLGGLALGTAVASLCDAAAEWVGASGSGADRRRRLVRRLGQREREQGPRAGSALHQDVSAHHLSQTAADREAEPRSAM